MYALTARPAWRRYADARSIISLCNASLPLVYYLLGEASLQYDKLNSKRTRKASKHRQGGGRGLLPAVRGFS